MLLAFVCLIVGASIGAYVVNFKNMVDNDRLFVDPGPLTDIDLRNTLRPVQRMIVCRMPLTVLLENVTLR